MTYAFWTGFELYYHAPVYSSRYTACSSGGRHHLVAEGQKVSIWTAPRNDLAQGGTPRVTLRSLCDIPTVTKLVGTFSQEPLGVFEI